MKKILLKFAHFIIKKYGIVPLKMQDKVYLNNTIFQIQSYTISKDYVSTTATLSLTDNYLNELNQNL